MSKAQSGQFNFHEFTDAGSPLVGGRVYTYAAGTTTQKVAYTDKAGLVSHTYTSDGIGGLYIALDSRGELPAPLYFSTGGYDIKLCRADGSTVWTRNADPSDTALRDDLASTATGKGAALVGTKRTGIATASATTVQAEIDALPVDAVVNFGADNSGTLNATAALFAFFTAAIAHGSGHIPAGRYRVTRSVLAFDTGGLVDVDFPVITTDAGVEFFVDSGTPGTVGPILAFTNGIQTSNAGKYWKGGYLGDIQLTGLADTTLTYTSNAEHGLSIRGMQEVRFGLIYGYKLGGSAVYYQQALFDSGSSNSNIPDLSLSAPSATNPDPYHVGLCTFAGIKGEYCKWVFENQNWVGLTHTDLGTIRSIGNRSGTIYGIGTGCSAGPGSCSANAGYTVEDGAQTSTQGGSPSRFTMRGTWEIDGVQYGFRINRCDTFHAPQIRFVYRRNNTSGNPTTYWLAKTIDMCSGTSPAVRDVQISMLHRVEASSGAVLGDLGTWLSFAGSSAMTDVILDNVILADNSGLGATSALLVTSPPTGNGRVLVRYEGRPIFDSTWKIACLVRSSTADTVPNTGYTTATSKITYGTVLSNLGGYYDTANSWFTVPYSGLYRFSGQICLTVAAGTRVRMAVATDTAGVIAVQKHKNSYQTNAGAEHHQIDGVVSLTAGQRVFLMADQNSGTAALAMSAPNSTTSDLTWSIEAL